MEASRPPLKLLDQVRAAVRVRHYSIRTEMAYADWARRFVRFRGRRHPRDMSAAEVNAFLTHVLNRGGRGVVSPLDAL